MAAMRCDIRLYWTGLMGNVGCVERGHEFVAEIVGLQVLLTGFESDSMGLMILMMIEAMLCSSLKTSDVLGRRLLPCWCRGLEQLMFGGVKEKSLISCFFKAKI